MIIKHDTTVTALQVLRRLLTEITQDNTFEGDHECLWCGCSANSNYEAVVGFTWHDDDCAYLTAHMFLMVEDERSAGRLGPKPSAPITWDGSGEAFDHITDLLPARYSSFIDEVFGSVEITDGDNPGAPIVASIPFGNRFVRFGDSFAILPPEVTP